MPPSTGPGVRGAQVLDNLNERMDPTHFFKGDPGSPLKKQSVNGSTVVKGDCLQVLAGMGPSSLVTGPPIHVGDG